MSVRKDPRNGNWFFRKQWKLPSGKLAKIRGKPATNTKAAAEHAERKAIFRIENPRAAEKEEGREDEDVVPTVREYSATWMATYSATHKPSTRKAKQQILDADINRVFGKMRLDAIRQIDVDTFTASLLKGTKKRKALNRKTINNITSVLGSILKYARGNGVIGCLKLSFFMKAQPSDIRAVSQEEIMALLRVTTDQRYRVAILLASDAGMRIGEIRAVRWGDINELTKEVRIAQAYDRDGNLGSPKSWKPRTVRLSPRLWAEIKKLPQRGDLLITHLRSEKHLSYWSVNDKIHQLYDAAPEVTKPPMPWHCLRHSFCTALAAAGTPITVIKELAGHASIETTLRYVHVTADEKRAAIDAVFSAAADQPEEARCPVVAPTETEKRKPALTT